MKQITRLLAAAVAGAMLAACSTSNSAPPTPNNPANPSAPGYSTLQFQVGYLTLPTGGTGLNLVSTLRHGGASAVLVNTPTISGPLAMPASIAVTPTGSPPGDTYGTLLSGGPSLFDTSVGQFSGTSQLVHPGAPACDTTNVTAPPGFTSCAGTGLSAPTDTSFGYSGGVFVNGLQPANYSQFSKPYTFAPYPLPAFAPAASQFTPYGGPPAFDDQSNGMGFRDGQHCPTPSVCAGAGLFGAVTGMTAFQLPQTTTSLQCPPATQCYGMSVTMYNGSTATTLGPVTAGIPSGSAPLGAITPPTITVDGKGGATVVVPPFPAGVTEEYVYITDAGPGTSATNPTGANCQGIFGSAEAPVFYTLVFTAAGTYLPPSSATPTGGTENIGLPDTVGPNINQSAATAVTPSPTICSATQNNAAVGAGTGTDNFTAVAVGLNYDLYGASAPKNKSQNPTISSASGHDDMTVSTVATGTGGP